MTTFTFTDKAPGKNVSIYIVSVGDDEIGIVGRFGVRIETYANLSARPLKIAEMRDVIDSVLSP